MRGIYNFVVTPKGERYNNTKKVGDKELIINTEICNHKHVNREATVMSTPIVGSSLGIKPGDTIITHFNVFRRWHDVKGRERNSRSYFDEKTYLVNYDQIFLHKRDRGWIAPKGYCFIQPVKETDKFETEVEKQSIGVVKYSDGTFDIGDVRGFRPGTACEFIIDGQKLYRVLSNLITIKYGYQGNEEVYNPSWA